MTLTSRTHKGITHRNGFHVHSNPGRADNVAQGNSQCSCAEEGASASLPLSHVSSTHAQLTHLNPRPLYAALSTASQTTPLTLTTGTLAPVCICGRDLPQAPQIPYVISLHFVTCPPQLVWKQHCNCWAPWTLCRGHPFPPAPPPAGPFLPRGPLSHPRTTAGQQESLPQKVNNPKGHFNV